MSIPPGTVTPLSPTYLNVPSEIWGKIFDEFRDEGYFSYGKISWRQYTYEFRDHVSQQLRTLQSLRLVCRLFNHIASPLLCPYMRIEISQSSLDRLLGLTKNEQIIGGLRGVQLSLAYRPRELAYDIGRYARYKQDCIHFKIIPHCEIETESLNRDSITDKTDARAYRLFRCLDEYKALSSACEYYNKKDSNTESEHSMPYREILRQSFESYQKLHEIQYKLLMDGTLVRTMANVIAQARRPIAVNLNDFVFWYQDDLDFEDDDYATGLLLDRWKLDRILIEAHTWEHIEQMANEFNWGEVLGDMPQAPMILPIRVLADLPISIHKAGGNLNSLNIDCFSSQWKDIPMMYSNYGSSATIWNELQAACQKVEVFKFGSYIMNASGSTRHYVPIEEKVYVDRYISAILTCPRLKQANIDMACFQSDDNGDSIYYRLGTYIPTDARSSLTSISLHYVHVFSSDLEALCRLVGPGPTNIGFEVVEIKDKSWSNALSLLRSQVMSGTEGKKCDLEIFHVTGGEFGEEVPSVPDEGDEGNEYDEDQAKAYEEYQRKIEQAKEYVLGFNDDVAWSRSSFIS